jgi:hypothetical protein
MTVGSTVGGNVASGVREATGTGVGVVIGAGVWLGATVGWAVGNPVGASDGLKVGKLELGKANDAGRALPLPPTLGTGDAESETQPERSTAAITGRNAVLTAECYSLVCPRSR